MSLSVTLPLGLVAFINEINLCQKSHCRARGLEPYKNIKSRMAHMNRTKGHPLDCAITSDSCVPKSFGNILVRRVKKSITRSCRSIAPHSVTTCRLVKENRTKQMLAKVDQDDQFSKNDRNSHHPKKRNHHEMEASWREICLSMHRGTSLSKIE
jgi:hypothetical protein